MVIVIIFYTTSAKNGHLIPTNTAYCSWNFSDAI